MIFFLTILALSFIFWGAIYGRLDGGGWASPEWLERLLVMSGFVMACAIDAGFYSLLAFIGVAGIATGHGLYFPSMAVKAATPEFFDFIVRIFFGEDPRTAKEFEPWRGKKWADAPQEVKDKLHLKMQEYGHDKLFRRCAFGMFVTGTIVGLPAFVILAIFGKFYSAFFLLTGVIKSVSYVVCWKIFKKTEPAELSNGGGRNALCLTVIFFALSAILSAII